MTDRILSLLGLARRAGKLEAGFDAAQTAARAKKAFLLTAAADISEKTFKNLSYEAGRCEIRAVRLPFSAEEVGRACGVKAGVMAVTDRGFAGSLLKLIESSAQKKEETSL